MLKEVSRLFTFRIVWNLKKGNKTNYNTEKINTVIEKLLKQLQEKEVITSYKKYSSIGSDEY